MADKKISELTAHTAPLLTDLLAIVDTAGNATEKIIIGNLWAVLNAPEGTLINGKIVPSVASNNLTVALKTLAGTNPSASDPVYVMIGGVVRSITGALSFTRNAGTNWSNLGSTELATKETDLFAYLRWNVTTSSVLLVYSRIPYGTLASDFSETTTNEKYMGPYADGPSTDTVVCIGRFAATLSAGAGYTWSVPAFTASNLIQRLKEWTRRLDWTPTLTWTTGTPETNVVTVAKYKLIDNILHFEFYYKADDGNAATALTITLPFSPKDNNSVISLNGQQKVDTTWSDPLAYIDDGGTVVTFRNLSACTDTKAVIVAVTGSYEI